MYALYGAMLAHVPPSKMQAPAIDSPTACSPSPPLGLRQQLEDWGVVCDGLQSYHRVGRVAQPRNTRRAQQACGGVQMSSGSHR